MASVSDRLRFKDRILDNVAKAIKSIQEQQLGTGSEDILLLKNHDRACYKLCEHLDHVFMHGLRHINHGYWNVVTEFTRKDAVKEIKRLKNVTTDLGRGRAWVLMAMNECLLESYIRCYDDNEKTVRKHYVRDALLLDQQRVNVLLTLTSGLEYVVFELDYDVPYLDLGMSPPRSSRVWNGSESSDQEDDRLSISSMESIRSSSLRTSSFTPAIESGLSVSDTSETTSLNSMDSLVQNPVNNNKFDLKNLSQQSGSQTPTFDRLDRLDNMVNDEGEEDEIDGLGGLEVIRVKGHKGKSGKKKKSRKTRQSNSPVCQQPLSEENEEVKADGIMFNDDSSISDSVNNKKLDEILGFRTDILKSSETENDPAKDEKNVENEVEGQSTMSVFEKMNSRLLAYGEDVSDNHSSDTNLVGSEKSTVADRPHSRSEELNDTPDVDVYASETSHSAKGYDIYEDMFESGDSQHVGDKTESSTYKDLSSEGVVQFHDKLNAQHICDKSDTPDNSSGEENLTSELPLPAVPAVSAINSQPSNHNSDSNEMQDADIDDIYSTNQKSAASQLQDRVDDIINETNVNLHQHMFEEEPEEIDPYDNSSSKDKKLADGEVELDNNTKLYLMLDVFDNAEEQFMKIFATRVGHTDGDVQPIFVLITDRTLYLLNQKQSDNRFSKETSIPFSSIDYISLSISDQVIQIVCTNRRNQYWLTSGCQEVTRSITETLSAAVEQTGLSKLSVLTDATTQKIAMRKYVARECHADSSDVEIACYSLIHWDDPHAKGNNSESAFREGHLLYRLQEPAGFIGSQLLQKVQDPKSLIYGQTWKAAYVVLKDGLLCVYSDKNDSKPINFVKMGGEDCVGCRRSTKTDRDHCIEVIKADGSSWQMSLASDTEANLWLQSLCQAVADGLELYRQKPSNRPACLPCCSILTPQKLLMCHEDLQTSFFRTLGSASIENITSVLTDDSVKSYCVLDFDSRDVDSRDQWVLYFNTGSETQRFIQALSKMWSEYFQVEVPVLDVDDFSLQRKCREMAQQLDSVLKVR